MGSDNAHRCAQNSENCSALTFLERYHEDGDELLNYIVRVTGDEPWVSFMSDETKEQTKQWMHTHSPNWPKRFKQTLSACMKAYDDCFLGQERSADVELCNKGQQ
jgi:hypothetical protein